MKKSILSFIALLVLLSSKSQLAKSTWLLTGNLNLRSSNYTVQNGSQFKQFEVEIAPKVGYFIVDKMAVGLYPAFSFSNNLSIPDNQSAMTAIQLGPFARYYFLSKDKQLNIFAESSYRYTSTRYSRSNTDGSITSIGVGPVIYFNSAVGLEFAVTYQIIKAATPNIKSTTKHIGLSIGLQVHLKNETN